MKAFVASMMRVQFKIQNSSHTAFGEDPAKSANKICRPGIIEMTSNSSFFLSVLLAVGRVRTRLSINTTRCLRDATFYATLFKAMGWGYVRGRRRDKGQKERKTRCGLRKKQ